MFLFGGYEFPQLMTINLGQLTTADPHFDSAGFLSFAQGAYWKIHEAAAGGDLDPVRNMLSESMLMQLRSSIGTPIWKTPIQALQQASIMSVAHDASYDTVTVRIGATSAAKKKSSVVEDWTFRRASTNSAVAAAAGTPPPTPTQCPGCGAPISVDERGACRYCGVPIAGVVGDWRLVSTTTPKVAKSSSSAGSGVRAYVVFIVLMTVVLPLAITGFVFWQVGKSTDSFTSGFDNNFGFRNPSTTQARTLSNPTGQPTMDGSLTFTGGLQGTMEPSNLSTTGGEVGTCSARVANVSGVSYLSNVDNADAGLVQQIIVNVTFAAGEKGPGTHAGPDVKVVLHETAKPGATNATPEDNSWTSGAGSTATASVNADNSGTVTFANLVTTAPQWAKLNGTLNFTCH